MGLKERLAELSDEERDELRAELGAVKTDKTATGDADLVKLITELTARVEKIEGKNADSARRLKRTERRSTSLLDDLKALWS